MRKAGWAVTSVGKREMKSARRRVMRLWVVSGEWLVGHDLQPGFPDDRVFAVEGCGADHQRGVERAEALGELDRQHAATGAWRHVDRFGGDARHMGGHGQLQ